MLLQCREVSVFPEMALGFYGHITTSNTEEWLRGQISLPLETISDVVEGFLLLKTSEYYLSFTTPELLNTPCIWGILENLEVMIQLHA